MNPTTTPQRHHSLATTPVPDSAAGGPDGRPPTLMKLTQANDRESAMITFSQFTSEAASSSTPVETASTSSNKLSVPRVLARLIAVAMMAVAAFGLIAQPASATVYSPYGHASFVADCSQDSGMVAQTISMYGHRGQRLEYRKWLYSDTLGRWVAGSWLGGYSQLFDQSQAYLPNQGRMWFYVEYRWATTAGWVYRTEYADTYQTVGFYAPTTYRVNYCQM